MMTKILNFPISNLNQEIKVKTKLEKVDEARIREIIRYLIFKRDDGFFIETLSENNFIFEIIKLIKCDVKSASEIIAKMNTLGLGICRPLCNSWSIDGTNNYDILRFAQMRDYVTEAEIDDFRYRRARHENMLEKYEEELEKERKKMEEEK